MRRLYAALAAAGTVLGVLVAATTLFDWFGEQVDPPPPPPPSEIDARVTAVDLRGSNERLADYLRETNQSTVGLTKHQASEEGYVFLVGFRLQGNEGQPVALRWSMIDAGTGRPLRGPIYNQPPPVAFKPRGPNQRRTWPLWVPSPPRKGSFRVRVTLIDEKRQPLDEADSEPFTLTRRPAP
jgi:hypothetical protein